MTRTTHRHHVTIGRRSVERFGRSAAVVTTPLCLEAALDGGPCPDAAAALDRLGRLLAGADVTGWFPEPVAPDLARWLDERLRPVCHAARRTLLFVSVTAPDLRCEYSPD